MKTLDKEKINFLFDLFCVVFFGLLAIDCLWIYKCKVSESNKNIISMEVYCINDGTILSSVRSSKAGFFQVTIDEYCPACGCSKNEVAYVLKCNNCNQQINIKEKYCGNCGVILNEKTPGISLKQFLQDNCLTDTNTISAKNSETDRLSLCVIFYLMLFVISLVNTIGYKKVR